jgi:hypothetical protein
MKRISEEKKYTLHYLGCIKEIKEWLMDSTAISRKEPGCHSRESGNPFFSNI